MSENQERINSCKKKMPVKANEDVEMEDLEIYGEPLDVSMLSEGRMAIDPLQNQIYQDYHDIEKEASSFEINPLSVKDARFFFHNFEFSDTLKSQFLSVMDFAGNNAKTYTLFFCANADNPQERSIGFMLHYSDLGKVF
jgi:hypothetical protein